ncbi:hypothetical protein [Methylovulum psychrotolerans]|uniref:Uncharacterized protein n=1 Tax=Methylovulum psychrotolerans TaxID=1704499 RepID=A0A1Z4C2F3_9GAMM|nr:hypothetical protein [Methylovulum psychrotolerans]ASF47694.1 hypothetical protein CEK71_17370 [Methylovulum psychrotolerans]
MIDYCLPLLAGNGVKVYLSPPPGALLWRVARNSRDAFAEGDAAELIYEGNALMVLDYAALSNGVAYFYKAFYFDGTVWDGQYPARSVTPGAFFTDTSIDPQALVRERLDSGLAMLVANGTLKHRQNRIPVLTASPQLDKVALPVVTVQLRSDTPEQLFVGDALSEAESGWLSAVTLEIVVWSQLGGDERKALRQAVKGLVIANLEVFVQAGMQQIQLSLSDAEEFDRYQSPVYLSRLNLQCLCQSGVAATVPFPVFSTSVSVS